MNGHGQYCPISRAADILNQRWTLLIMRDILYGGARRFNEVRKGVPRMSPTLLSQRLKSLVGHGLIERRRLGKGRVEYHPTRAGEELRPILDLYGVWGQRWVREPMPPEMLDVGLLMWYLHLGVDPARFPDGETVIGFEYTDRPRLARGEWWLDKWWLIVRGGETDLCVEDPGKEVDLYVVTDLRTMTEVSLGDRSVRSALSSGAIELIGSRSLAGSFEDWLPRSGFAEVARPPEPLDLRSALASLADP